MHVVTISATFGAGGSVVGPAVAERLGVPFLDRAIPTSVADDLGIPLEEAVGRDEQVQGRFTRFLAAAAPASAEWMIGEGPTVGTLVRDEHLLACTREAIRRGVADGGVVLGRAGAIVLRDHPTALHVRLDGNPEDRVKQAMEILGMTEKEARESLPRNDAARAAYVRQGYRADASACEHYHLVLDSCRVPPEACVEIVVTAVRARDRHGRDDAERAQSVIQPR